MGVYGKQQNAPGYQKVAAERREWREIKEKHLTYTWFVEELEKSLKSYKEYLNGPKYWMNHSTRVWSKKSKKWINTSRNTDERLYWDMVYVGNGMKDIDDYRDVIKIPSWRHESCCVFEDVLSEMKKAVLYEFYNEEKEKKNMGEEDNKPRRNSQKRVRFAWKKRKKAGKLKKQPFFIEGEF